MSALDLARWQFGIVTVYHFIFVPLTIGLAPLVAIMQTIWYRTGNEKWLRMTKFFGQLFLINFALGVVTGIVQEFQFGMNWSKYSEFVGDVFGAPLAMEALIAFFLESTFLGVWIFGWQRISKRAHLASIWLAAIGVNASAYFILAANSFMQHPVGVKFNPETKRAELESIMAVLTNRTAVEMFGHTIAASFLTAATFIAGIAGWWMVKHARANRPEQAATYRPALRLALVTLLVAGLAVIVTGDLSGKQMVKQQPMKMAAGEALCQTEKSAPFSFVAILNADNECRDVKSIGVPGVLSFLSTNDFNATVRGVNDIQAEQEKLFGPGDYKPLMWVTFWSFRFMILLAAFSAALALAGLWLTRKGKLADKKWFSKLCLIALPMPFLACTFGWLFTEMGRQPWVVSPNMSGDPSVRMLTKDGVSPLVDSPSVLTSMVVFTVLYGVLAGVWFMLIRRYAREGAAAPPSDDGEAEKDDSPLAFSY